MIYGDKGKLEIPRPHGAKEVILYDKEGKEISHFIDTKTENGFVYEIQEAAKCIRERKIESEVVPHKLTLDCSKLFDSIQAAKE